MNVIYFDGSISSALEIVSAFNDAGIVVDTFSYEPDSLEINDQSIDSDTEVDITAGFLAHDPDDDAEDEDDEEEAKRDEQQESDEDAEDGEGANYEIDGRPVSEDELAPLVKGHPVNEDEEDFDL